MKTLRARTAAASLGLLALGVTTACGTLRPPALLAPNPETAPSVGGVAQASPTDGVPTTDGAAQPPATTSSASTRATGPRTALVKRDSITRSLALEGAVVPQAQVPITYPNRATVADIKIKQGDTVTEGDVLIEMEPGEVNRQLSEARNHLQASQLALAQGNAQTSARQQQAAQQAQLDQRQRQLAVADANTTLRRAQENLDKVMAGAPLSERRAAQDAVDKADAAVQKAQDAYDKLTAGPDQAAERAAQREVANNQIALSKAQSDLDMLTRGPDPAAVRSAQGDVQRAQTQLQIAQTAMIDPKAPDPAVARMQHDAAVQDAQLAVQSAQARLDKLKQPPLETDVQTARQKVKDAQEALDASNAKLTTLQAGADEATIGAAEAALEKAQQALSDAQAKQTEVESRPTRAEAADAQDQIRRAQSALDAAQRGSVSPQGAEGAVDLDALQAAVEQDQATIASLEQALENTRLKAPFDATVVAIRVKVGEAVTSSKPVLVLSKPGAPLLQLDLDDSQVGVLSVGQPAVVRFEGTSTPGPDLEGRVTSVVPSALDGSTIAKATLQVKWGDVPTPKFGTLMSVTIPLEQKSNVLVLPKAAVRQAGGRTTVEIQDGGLRRLVPVQVGIQSDTSIEIISGLNEGQTVVVTGG